MITFTSKKQQYPYKNCSKNKSAHTNTTLWQKLDLQKSDLGKVGTYKKQVWAMSGHTKIRFGRRRGKQKPGLGKVGLTRIRIGRSRDLQKSG